MKRHGITLLSAALLAALIIACSGSGSSGGNETRSPGELAFRANCQTCHRLPKPGSQPDEKWPALVERYGGRAKLSQEQIAQITAYLISAN